MLGRIQKLAIAVLAPKYDVPDNQQRPAVAKRFQSKIDRAVRLIARTLHECSIPYLHNAALPIICYSRSAEQAGNMIEGAITMCRNIKTLFNFGPPAKDQEVRDA